MKLRSLLAKDADLMLEWMKDDELNQFFSFRPENVSKSSVEQFIFNSSQSENNRHYAIVDDQDTYLGTVSLKNIDTKNSHAEYAIALRRVAIGTGIARESTLEILTVAFEDLSLHRVYLCVPVENIRANRFYQKFGFSYEGMSVDHLCISGKYYNLNWYAILNNQKK